MSIRHSAAAATRTGLPPGTDHLRYFGYDHEPLTPQELAAIEEGERAAARGESIPWAEVRRELERRVAAARKKGVPPRAARGRAQARRRHP